MTATVRTIATKAFDISSVNGAARWTGILYIITFITSIPALLLFGPVLNDADYIVSGGADNRIFLGAFLEILLIVANIGSALAPYAILKRYHERLALSYVAARIMESVFIGVGILAVLSVVTLRQDFVGATGTDSTALIAIGKALVAVKDWTFLFGPGFCGIGNGMMLGYMMYRSRLMPRRLTYFGLVGGPLMVAAGIAALFGVFEPSGAAQFILTIPEIIWELSIGLWLTVKGASALTRGSEPTQAESSAPLAAQAA
jgi:Domain of unknown function (DUF4386)